MGCEQGILKEIKEEAIYNMASKSNLLRLNINNLNLKLIENSLQDLITKESFLKVGGFIYETINEQSIKNENEKNENKILKLILEKILYTLKDQNHIYKIVTLLLPFIDIKDYQLKIIKYEIDSKLGLNNDEYIRCCIAAENISFILSKNRTIYNFICLLREIYYFFTIDFNKLIIFEILNDESLYNFLAIRKNETVELPSKNDFIRYFNNNFSLKLVENEFNKIVSNISNKYSGDISKIEISNNEILEICVKEKIGCFMGVREKLSILHLNKN